MMIPITLTGRYVRLEPLTTAHVPALCRVGLDPALWAWIPTPVTTRAQMEAYVMDALAERERSIALPFAIIDTASGNAIGSTRYTAIDLTNKRLEIGWTWLARSHQRSGANTEAKLMLLTHAFEALDLNRVELKTDVLNTQSRNAILRLGATQEGIFRRHVITVSGRARDTVYFSIIAEEWPAIKTRLQSLMR
jgi:RimJ/RimL family protein N-acetyltransferase